MSLANVSAWGSKFYVPTIVSRLSVSVWIGPMSVLVLTNVSAWRVNLVCAHQCTASFWSGPILFPCAQQCTLSLCLPKGPNSYVLTIAPRLCVCLDWPKVCAVLTNAPRL